MGTIIGALLPPAVYSVNKFRLHKTDQSWVEHPEIMLKRCTTSTYFTQENIDVQEITYVKKR